MNLDSAALRERYRLATAWTYNERVPFFKLRYRELCERQSLEKAENYPKGLEFDAFDAAGLAALLYYRGSDVLLGGVRVVPVSERKLPLSAAVPMVLPGQCWEISRLVVEQASWQRGDQYAWAVLSMAAVALCERHNAGPVFVLAEPELADRLRGLGVSLDAMTPLLHYRGQRVVYQLSVLQTLRGLKQDARSLYDWAAACMAERDVT